MQTDREPDRVGGADDRHRYAGTTTAASKPRAGGWNSPNPASVPEWYEAPTFYFTNPYALVGPTTTCRSRPGLSCWTSSWKSRLS